MSQSWSSSYVYSDTKKGDFGAISFNQKTDVIACALSQKYEECSDNDVKEYLSCRDHCVGEVACVKVCDLDYNDACKDKYDYRIMLLKISEPIVEGRNPRYFENSHNGTINSVSFNSVTNMLASGSSDGTVKLWKTNTGDISMCESDAIKCLYAINKFHQGPVNIVVFNTKTNIVASGADDKYISIWDVTKGSYNSLYGHTGPVLSLAFNEENNILASGSTDKSIKLWNNLGLLRTLYHNEPVISLSFNPNTDTLASCTSTTIKFWTSSTGLLTWSNMYTFQLKSVVFDVKANMLYYSHSDMVYLITQTKFFTMTKDKIEIFNRN